MKKAVIFLPLNDEVKIDQFEIPTYLNLNNTHIHIVHCHKIHTYVNELSLYSFPNEGDFESIIGATNLIISNFAKNFKLENFTAHCFFDHSPKEKCLDFLKEVKADYCLLFATDKSSFDLIFNGSFMSFMNTHSPCDVINLRA